MRFLIDENLSPQICALLIDGGHHATHIRDYGMAASALDAGAFVVLTPRAVRVRHLPLR